MSEQQTWNGVPIAKVDDSGHLEPIVFGPLPNGITMPCERQPDGTFRAQPDKAKPAWIPPRYGKANKATIALIAISAIGLALLVATCRHDSSPTLPASEYDPNRAPGAGDTLGEELFSPAAFGCSGAGVAAYQEFYDNTGYYGPFALGDEVRSRIWIGPAAGGCDLHDITVTAYIPNGESVAVHYDHIEAGDMRSIYLPYWIVGFNDIQQPQGWGWYTTSLQATQPNGDPFSGGVSYGAIARDVDINADGEVNTDDLLMLIAAWGESGWTDIDFNGATGVSDLLAVINAWGTP